MAVYALAQLTIHDPDRYARYASRFLDVLLRFNGRVLAADTQPEVIEGTWERDKVVLLSFQNAEAFWAWAGSDDYQKISVDRVASTEGPVILIHGYQRK